MFVKITPSPREPPDFTILGLQCQTSRASIIATKNEIERLRMRASVASFDKAIEVTASEAELMDKLKQVKYMQCIH
jgi:hypothetical protein